ncbi:MAG TPA: hypothetical protein VE974_17960 [Thermoanaerobaculia bacterium]|nr:hypothetical protein [Thermoanaerobaculia bacterium]
MPITYVDDNLAQRDWKIEHPIAVRQTIIDYLSMPEPGDILIIHGGQRDARMIAPSGRELLLEAILRVCGNGGRAIVFSGGAPIISVRTIRETLSLASLHEGVHYLILTAIQNLPLEIDFPSLLRATPTPEWRIAEVKRRHAVPTLWTLALLCQSALLAFDPKNVDDEAVTLLGGREAMIAVRGSSGFTGDQLLAPHAWHGALAARAARPVCDAIEKEWPADAGTDDGVRRLVDALYDRSRALDAGTVAQAFCALYRALRQNQELQH